MTSFFVAAGHSHRYNRRLFMPLSAGTRLGPYKIIAPLGVGGMGEVYRARDTKLKRDVAIKVLPEAVAADRERLARLQREAKSSPRSIIPISRISTVSKTPRARPRSSWNWWTDRRSPIGLLKVHCRSTRRWRSRSRSQMRC